MTKPRYTYYECRFRDKKTSAKISNESIRIAAFLSAILFVCMSYFPLAVSAESPLTRSIDITVELENSGGGYVTEVWDVRTVDGTEFYLAKYNLKDQEITDLSVMDETGADYQNIGAWNSNRSLREKEGECGLISIDNGYEICWGIGDNYGNHIYTIRYYISNLVKSCNDYDILYQQFIATDLLAEVQRVNLTIKALDGAFTQENTGVWGFGHTGDIQITDGTVVLNSLKQLERSEYVTVLLRFDKGLFAPIIQIDAYFEDIRSEAFRGSSYTLDTEADSTKNDAFGADSYIDDSYIRGGFTFSKIASFIIVAFIIAFTLLLFRFNPHSRRKLSSRRITKAYYKELAYCREIPFYGLLISTYYRLQESGVGLAKMGNLIGAFILKWINEGEVRIVSKSGWFGKEQPALQLLSGRFGVASGGSQHGQAVYSNSGTGTQQYSNQPAYGGEGIGEQQQGQAAYYNNGTSTQQYGNQPAYGGGGISEQQHGQSANYNSGTSTQQYGNQPTYGGRGISEQQQGQSAYYNSGAGTQQYGSQPAQYGRGIGGQKYSHLYRQPSGNAFELEQELYTMLVKAAGQDYILESKEIKRWSERNYQKIQLWLKDISSVACLELQNTGCATQIEEKGIFGIKRKRLIITPQGEAMTDRMYGFKKFLEEFTIINERDPNEVRLWSTYLIYAQIFGIAEEVTRRISNLYPQLLNDPNLRSSSMDIGTALFISGSFGHSMHSGYSSGMQSSSSGGGGGFSGGGGGGASGGSSGGGGTR